MKVRILTSANTSNGSYQERDMLDLPEQIAMNLINIGFAVSCEDKEPERKKKRRGGHDYQ